MIVKQEDLVGAIEGFPLHVVQQMVDNQVAQGNEANIRIFQNKKDTPKRFGGFDWNQTPQGTKYWSRVFNAGIFDEELATTEPAKDIVKEDVKERETPTYKFGDIVTVERGSHIKDKVVIAYVPDSPNPLWCVSKNVFDALMDGSSDRGMLTSNKELDRTVYLTLEDISKGKGVGVDPAFIKIV